MVTDEGFKSLSDAGGFFREGYVDDFAVMGRVADHIATNTGDDGSDYVDTMALFFGKNRYGGGRGGGGRTGIKKVFYISLHVFNDGLFFATLGTGRFGYVESVVRCPSDLEEAFAKVAVDGPSPFDGGGDSGNDSDFAMPDGRTLTGTDGETAIKDFTELGDDFALFVLAFGKDGGEVFESDDAGESDKLEERGLLTVHCTGEKGFGCDAGFHEDFGKDGCTVDDDGGFPGAGRTDDE